MQEENSYIGGLLIKVTLGEHLEEKELADLHKWKARSHYHQDVVQQFRDGPWVMGEIQKMRQYPVEEEWQRLMDNIDQEPPTASPIPSGNSPRTWLSRRIWKYSIAAAIFLVLCTGVYFFRSRSHPQPIPVKELTSTPKKDKTPGPQNYRVALIRADSSILRLDSVHHYIQPAPPDYTVSPGDNTLSTHQAEPFVLSLPDGSKIKLSYSSSLTYPVEFIRETREVTLSGEAYFEIAPNAQKPFIIHANGTEIKVLGTAFNIKAYPEEPVSEISVFKGSVKVMRGNHIAQLNHFEQVSVTNETLKKSKITDSTAVMAWTAKNPAFVFRNTELPTAIREVARWFNLKVYSPDHIRGITLTTTLSRAASLKEILYTIEQIESGNAFLKTSHDTIIISATK